MAKAPGRSAQRPVRAPREASRNAKQDARKLNRRNQDALTNYCVNLNKKAMAGKIDPLIGRELEIERTIQILCRRTKNNPLYVGDPGVGKTAIAEGLASGSSRATCRKFWPNPLSSRWIWARCWPAPVIAATSRSG